MPRLLRLSLAAFAGIGAVWFLIPWAAFALQGQLDPLFGPLCLAWLAAVLWLAIAAIRRELRREPAPLILTRRTAQDE